MPRAPPVGGLARCAVKLFALAGRASLPDPYGSGSGSAEAPEWREAGGSLASHSQAFCLRMVLGS